MDPQFLNEVLGSLFSIRRGRPSDSWGPELPPSGGKAPGRTEDIGVTGKELVAAVKKLRINKASGPDGVPGKIWTLPCRAL